MRLGECNELADWAALQLSHPAKSGSGVAAGGTNTLPASPLRGDEHAHLSAARRPAPLRALAQVRRLSWSIPSLAATSRTLRWLTSTSCAAGAGTPRVLTPSTRPVPLSDLMPSPEVFTGLGHFTWAEPDVVTSSMG